MHKSQYIIIFTVILVLIFSCSGMAVNLEEGDRGPEVEEAQRLLDKLGYNLDIDGIFGYQTREAVRDFQLNNGLTVDGIIGKKTMNLLEKYSKEIEYEVKKGDTLSGIALKYDSTVQDIKKRNNLKSDLIVEGQVLNIPKTGIGGGREERIYSNIIHTVQPGDALIILARKYGTNVDTIKLANNLRSDRIYVGQKLVIPHLSSAANRPFQLQQGAFIWPVMGRISSPYGWRIHPIKNTREFHQGLDIAVPLGTPIRAAAAGTVVQSGWLTGFGKTITIDHGQGVKTLYAHNSGLLVSSGTRVNIGDVIARAGSTGQSTGSHLHFGILVNEDPVNPRKYLP